MAFVVQLNLDQPGKCGSQPQKGRKLMGLPMDGEKAIRLSDIKNDLDEIKERLNKLESTVKPLE
mgnify:CR=1 FL=1|jgi:hypothetical protein